MPKRAHSAPNLANKTHLSGVSGDGDSASIRPRPIRPLRAPRREHGYVCENNGVYGLTKGQFSATADKGSKSKAGGFNSDSPIDLVALALVLGASFVARSFSGDRKAGAAHQGCDRAQGPAILDVISPCVQFNNHPGSTKSFDFVRAHNEAVNKLDFMPAKAEIKVDYEPGTVTIVKQHDGTYLKLAKFMATTIRRTGCCDDVPAGARSRRRGGDRSPFPRRGRGGPSRQSRYG